MDTSSDHFFIGRILRYSRFCLSLTDLNGFLLLGDDGIRQQSSPSIRIISDHHRSLLIEDCLCIVKILFILLGSSISSLVCILWFRLPSIYCDQRLYKELFCRKSRIHMLSKGFIAFLNTYSHRRLVIFSDSS